MIQELKWTTFVLSYRIVFYIYIIFLRLWYPHSFKCFQTFWLLVCLLEFTHIFRSCHIIEMLLWIWPCETHWDHLIAYEGPAQGFVWGGIDPRRGSGFPRLTSSWPLFVFTGFCAPLWNLAKETSPLHKVLYLNMALSEHGLDNVANTLEANKIIRL